MRGPRLRSEIRDRAAESRAAEMSHPAIVVVLVIVVGNQMLTHRVIT